MHDAGCDAPAGIASCDCTTAVGYQGPVCADDIDECTATDSNAHLCLNGGECQNNIGGYTCNCTMTDFIGTFCDIGE